MKWQPIETAPKDGTLIDVFVTGHGRVCDVYWSFNTKAWQNDRVWYIRASHWMPRPESPNQ